MTEFLQPYAQDKSAVFLPNLKAEAHHMIKRFSILSWPG